MAQANLFALCDDALCVSEDSAVAIYAPKMLKKIRVERLSGARVCGLHIQRVGNANSLHVMDAEGNYFVLSLKDVVLTSSTTIRLREADVDATVDGAKAKPVITSSRRGNAARPSSQNPAERTAGGGIKEAHFHEADGILHCALLTELGVWEVPLLASKAAAAHAPAARCIAAFPLALSDTVMSVGLRTGLVCVAQKGQRWLQYVPYDAHRSDASMLNPTAPRHTEFRRVLNIAVESLCCSPVNESVAVGGNRGELVIFPSVFEPHFYSDHWHHTALAAITFTADGMSLLTGARESVLLVWSLTTYTHRKIVCNLGPIRCAVPSTTNGATVLVACGVATLATVNLLEMRMQQAVEGVEWSAGQSCSGLVVDSWMGRPIVILTGLPNVLRLCDPLTQQALYSLHISSQMETVPTPPRHGIRYAGLLREGRVIVTLESFPLTALPDMLRFWTYDAAARRHIEAQTLYKPHDSEVLALQVNKSSERVFTLSRDAVKCWEEVLEDPNDALRKQKRSWRNLSTSPVASDAVQSLTLSNDGSLCLVADDSVHVYSVARCQPGVRWPKVFTLYQSSGTSALSDLTVFSSAASAQHGAVVVAARDDRRVFLWNLLTPAEMAVSFEAPAGATVTALCSLSADSVLVATSDLCFAELSCKASDLGAKRFHMKHAVAHPVLFMAPLPGEESRVAVVDAVSGFRVLILSSHHSLPEEERFTALDGDAAVRQERDRTEATVNRFFNDMAITEGKGDGMGEEDDTKGNLEAAARASKAASWLKNVLQEPAYTTPSMSSVLSQYLKQRSGFA